MFIAVVLLGTFTPGMLRDVLAFVGLQSAVAANGDVTSSDACPPRAYANGQGSTSCISCAPPHMQKLLQEHQANGGPSIRLVIRGARRTGKSTLLSRMQGAGVSSSAYHPTQAIQPGVFLWRPRSSPTDDASSGAYPPATLSETRVELWDVVDHGSPARFPTPDSTANSSSSSGSISAALRSMLSLPTDATTVDVYRGAHGVILMYDVTSRDSFDYVLDALPRIPQHLPVAICGNFWDLVHTDGTKREVDERAVEQCLAAAHRAATPLFASFIAAAQGARGSCGVPVALSSFTVDPVHIHLSTKDGFGLTPLHRFTGLCAAFSKAIEADNAVRACYGRVASASQNLQTINDSQNYDEFLQWRTDAEARRRQDALGTLPQKQIQYLSGGGDVTTTTGDDSANKCKGSIRSAGRAKQRNPSQTQRAKLNTVATDETRRSSSNVAEQQQMGAGLDIGGTIDASFFEHIDDSHERLEQRNSLKDPRVTGEEGTSSGEEETPESSSPPGSGGASVRPPQRSFQLSAQERKMRVLEQLAAQSIIHASSHAPEDTGGKKRAVVIDTATIHALTHCLEENFSTAGLREGDDCNDTKLVGGYVHDS